MTVGISVGISHRAMPSSIVVVYLHLQIANLTEITDEKICAKLPSRFFDGAMVMQDNIAIYLFIFYLPSRRGMKRKQRKSDVEMEEITSQLIVYLPKRVPIMISRNPLQLQHKNLSTSSSSARNSAFLIAYFYSSCNRGGKLKINFNACSFSTLMLFLCSHQIGIEKLVDIGA